MCSAATGPSCTTCVAPGRNGAPSISPGQRSISEAVPPTGRHELSPVRNSSENDLMRLPEFTRTTTLPWSSPAWPYVLWLWPESSASRYCGQPLIFLFLADVAAALVRLAAASRPLRASRHHVAGRRRKVMHEMDTVARREDPAKPTSGLDAKRVADMSMVSVEALDDLWQRAMKNSPRAEGLRDNNLRKAAQRIAKEIRARRNPISFDGTEFES